VLTTVDSFVRSAISDQTENTVIENSKHQKFEPSLSLWENKFLPPKDGLELSIQHYSPALHGFLGGSREDWDVFNFQSDDEGIGVLLDAAVSMLVERNHKFNSNREFAVKEEIKQVKFLTEEFHKKLELNRAGQKLTAVEVVRGSMNNTLLALDIGFKIVFTSVSFNSSPASDSTDYWNIAIIRKDEVVKLREYLFKIYSLPKKSYRIYTYDANSSGAAATTTATGLFQTWDNLVLNEEILTLVKKDSEAFISRRDWFLKNNLPFRRGYLFHGPPGNGKTSVIKVLLSSLQMNAYKIRLFSKNIGDNILEAMFETAQKNGPSVVVLEDLDRAFPKTGETQARLNMHTLLNCLDGLTSQEGVITIATANEPTILDRAILKRPGRFDRVVFFDNPDHPTRIKYFLKKAPYLNADALGPASDVTEGSSFAQLQETYILAGQLAYERGTEEISVDDLINGANTLRGASCSISSEGKKKGFF